MQASVVLTEEQQDIVSLLMEKFHTTQAGALRIGLDAAADKYLDPQRLAQCARQRAQVTYTDSDLEGQVMPG